MAIFKNIERAHVLSLASLVTCAEGQVVSRTLAQNDAVSVTLFAFDAGEEIGTHESGGDALLTCLEGSAAVRIDDTDYNVGVGESIVMPAGHPHSVHAPEKFKMLLVVVF